MDEPLAALRRMLKTSTQSQIARRLMVSRQYVSDVLKGRRQAGPKLLAALGLERAVTVKYRKR
jgi:transcriptional regulator with XRE-family HTH domain